MKIFTQETGTGEGKPALHLLMIDRAEGKVLLEMAAAACEANKRKGSFSKVRKLLEEKLAVY